MLIGLKERGCRFQLEIWRKVFRGMLRPTPVIETLVELALQDLSNTSSAYEKHKLRGAALLPMWSLGIHLRLGSKFDA